MKGKEPTKGFHLRMEEIIADIASRGLVGESAPRLLLHSCCAPCSSSVIAVLASFFRITVFYYNPNIDEQAEYTKRAREQERLISQMPTPLPVAFLEGEYRPDEFAALAKDHEHDKEGGARCSLCYELRLEKTAKTARESKFDFFTSTLSVSPLKDAARINAIGNALEKKYGVRWLWSDFKKKDGYRRSVELSKEYGLYRQNYCGCSYSRRESDRELT